MIKNLIGTIGIVGLIVIGCKKPTDKPLNTPKDSTVIVKDSTIKVYKTDTINVDSTKSK